METAKRWTTEREIAHLDELLEYWRYEQAHLRRKAAEIEKTVQLLIEERNELLARQSKEKLGA